MWNVVYNPLETVIAPVIRGNPWGWDPATRSDDWPYVLFDWDTHFASCIPIGGSNCRVAGPSWTSASTFEAHVGTDMLSLDAKALGYSVLIQVVISRDLPLACLLRAPP